MESFRIYAAGMNENSEVLVSPGPPAKTNSPATQEEKAQWVRRFHESGLSLRKFSAQHSVRLMSLWRWVNQAKGPEDVAANSARPEFEEIKLPASIGRSDWAAELSLPNGTVLRLSKEVPAAMLDQLLRVC
jgi:hypothetical protein